MDFAITGRPDSAGSLLLGILLAVLFVFTAGICIDMLRAWLFWGQERTFSGIRGGQRKSAALRGDKDGNEENKWLVWTENALLPLILALYPLRHVWMGIDLRDTGYNYANFRYMGLAHMDSMWVFSTYLANVVGHFFSLLPGGDTLLFMNIYTALVVSVTALIAYFSW